MEEKNDMPTKYVFVTGGVVSGLGKGITSFASLGRLLKAGATAITIQKFDPYMKCRSGTVPYQHGEVFVTDDGAETDADLDSL